MAYENIHLVVEGTSLSPVLDPPTFSLNYQLTGGTGSLLGVNNLVAAVNSAMLLIPSGGTHSLLELWGPTISRASGSGITKAFDVTGHLNGTPHGPPIVTASFTPSAAFGGVGLPEGVCIVVTLQSPYGSDDEFLSGTRPRARDRGRIYFGPISTNALSPEATTNRSVVASATMTNLLGFVKSIASITPATGQTYVLSVWSRRAALMKPLSQAWVDDRPDYQRRRADQGATRSTIPLP